MKAADCGVNVLADQRYYHFVAFRDPGKFQLTSLWKALGAQTEPAHSVAGTGQHYVLQHKKWRLDKAFASGLVANALSEKGKGNPPYLYDVVAAKVQLGDEAFVLVGFPFVGLASYAIERMRANSALSKSLEFVSADVPKLVGIVDAEKQKPPAKAKRFEGLSVKIVNLQLVVTDDDSITGVRLGGNDPLAADIYVDFLQKRVSQGYVRPEFCILACERTWSETDSGRRGGETLRSRLRVDDYGNFRFYVHVGCANLRLLPFALGHLHMVGCLHKVLGDPLARASVGDQE